MHALQDLQALDAKGQDLPAEAWRVLLGHPWEGHGHIPQPPTCKHRGLHISFRSLCLSSFKAQIFAIPSGLL